MRESCLDALLKIQPYLDGELSAVESESVRHHLHVCAPCAPALGYFRNLRDVVHRAAGALPAAPDHLKTRIKSLIQASHSS